MPCATAHTVSLQGAIGHLIDVQADVSPGLVGTTLVGRPDASLHEARDRCRMAIVQQRLELAGDQADHDPAVAGRPAQARHPLRPRDRRGGAGRRRHGSPERPSSGTAFIGELTLTGGLRSVPGVLPMVMAAAARGITPRLRARAAGPRGGDGARHGRARHALAGPGRRRAARRRGARGAAGRADVGQPAAVLAR